MKLAIPTHLSIFQRYSTVALVLCFQVDNKRSSITSSPWAVVLSWQDCKMTINQVNWVTMT